MKRYFCLFVLLIVCLSTKAVELPEIIGDNMMLQQKTEAKLWGWAKGGTTVSVTPSWNGKTYSAKTDKKTGRWEIKIETPAASYETYSIKIKDSSEEKTISNVLIGEVWFCSGQSNMEMPLAGFWNCPVEGSNEAIATSGRYKKSIRVATIPKSPAQKPQDRVSGKWQVCEPETAGSFSACGYFFARTLTELLDIPVGIINCSWGGSCVEGWLPKEILLTYPDGLVPMDDTDYHAKMVMFNGMLSPLAGYTIKGFLWNQGESNVGREKEYIERFSTMTNLWREMWNQPGDPLPIYTVELPPYWYDNNDADNGAKFREAQHIIANQLENCGCVCTNDLVYDYEPKQIHGTKKLEIGQRLAYMAAIRNYGFKGIAAEAPEFDHMKVSADNKVVNLYFTNATDGFDRLSDIEGFEVAGADGVFYKATVSAEQNWSELPYTSYLKLVCPEVSEIKYIRYNFKNWAPSKLHNMRQLPIVPFRTDNF